MKMKRKLLSLLLALCLVLMIVPVSTFAAEEPSFGGGTGTQEAPWLITSQGDLIALAEFLNSGKAEEFDAGNNGIGNCHGYYFKQTADIDLTGVAWEPIGYSGSYYFAGNYDGDGHSIKNAISTGKVDPDGFATAGIFGWVAFGSVKNLHVKNANFVATGQNNYSYVGGIAGVCYGSAIINCSVVNSFLESKRNSNNNCAGSIVGYSTGGTFEKCAAENNQVKTMAYGGGFVGEVDDDPDYGAGTSTFTNCYTANCSVSSKTDDVQGVSLVGGFVGEMTDSALTVQNCYVYRATLSTEETAVPAIKATGVFAGQLWGGSSINNTNCFFGACGTTENVGTASEKTEEEFKNGTVAELLGEAFAQVGDYPKINGPADYSSVDAAIAKANALNKNDYKDFSAVETAVNAVTRGKNLKEQGEVDAMAKAIEDAVAALQYKDADYTKVDAAIDRANKLNKDNYKDFTGVEAAVNAVAHGKNITQQAEVDAMAKAIEDALAALQYKNADYTKVDAAIAKANALNKDNYKDFSGVEAAVKAVVRGKNITEQSEVDKMAKAIEKAIDALQYKGADYTKVDAAIAKAKALNKDNYKDFSGVEAAVKAVVRGKNITEQSEVDKMAKAIEKAIDALQYKEADYTKVDAAIGKVNALNKDNYKDFSGVEAAVKAVVRGKNITEQSEVDKMAKAIEKAIDALQYKGADYTKVDAAIAKAKALNKDNYKDFSGVEAAVKAVVRGKNVTKQSEVDAMAKAIEDAINALVYKDADYTKVDAAIAKAKALNKDNYKDFSGVEAAVKAVVRGKNVTKQSEVDAMAKAIEDAINALVYKDADYTKVDAAIAKAKALNKDNYKDLSGVEAAVKAVVRGKNITKQSEVDKMEKAIEDAIAAIQYKGANYTKVDAAIAKANSLNKDNYQDFSGVDDAVKAVVRGKNITEQSEVDKMAKAIEKAIDALQYKGADYTKVDAAIGKANALNKDNYKDFSGVESAVKAVVRGKNITEQSEVDKMAKAIDDAISVLQYKDADYTKVDAVIAKAPEPSKDFGDSNNTSTNGGRVTGTSDSSKNTDSRNNSGTETKPYIKDDKGKEGWDAISSQLDEAKSGETVTVAMNGTTVVPKDIFDSIKGEDVTLVLDMGNGLSWKINGKDITDAAGDIDFGVTVGADAGKSIPVDVINNVTGERYSMNLSLAYDGEFGFTARLTINMESKNTGLYANLFYYNEQTGELEFVSAGLIDADGNVELKFTHASDYTIVIDAAVMDGGNKDSINTTKDNENAKDNTTIPASNADNAKSDAWNLAIIIIIGICILLIVFGAVIFVRKKSGSEEE